MSKLSDAEIRKRLKLQRGEAVIEVQKQELRHPHKVRFLDDLFGGIDLGTQASYTVRTPSEKDLQEFAEKASYTARSAPTRWPLSEKEIQEIAKKAKAEWKR